VAEISDAVRLPGEEGKLVMQVEDTLTGNQLRVPVDMAILSVGLEPRADSKALAKTFGISCSADGWFIERHPKLDPVATMTDGIYIAGCVQGPKDIPASVVQGAAAAARILGKIQQKEVSLEPIRATINADTCSGCRICNSMCPFSAISFHEDTMVSEVNPALCQGCGTCVAACPAGAISGTGFSNEQILSQIDGLLLLTLDKKKEAAVA
jgi:heterodisulfide reductase subunit A